MADRQRLQRTRVGVLGSGQVGQPLARAFADRGHDVMPGSRDPGKEEVAAWLAGKGEGIAGGTFAETASHDDRVVLAVLGAAVEEAIGQAGPESLAGKVVIDATNPLDFSAGFPPRLVWGHTDSGGERAQRAAPDAHVVKAFNIIGSDYFVEPRFGEDRTTRMIAGNDADAKATAGHLVEDFALAAGARRRRHRRVARAGGALHPPGSDRRRPRHVRPRLQAADRLSAQTTSGWTIQTFGSQ